MKFQATLIAQRNQRSSPDLVGALTSSRITCPSTSFAQPLQKIRNPQSAIRNGFTLVEIMLALAIFTMLIGALYSTWILVTRATVVGKDKAAQLQRERIAMQTVEDSLTYIQSHQASIQYYLFNVQNGDQPLLGFTAYLPKDFPRSGEFLNDTPNGMAMDYHLRRLTYWLQPDEEGQGKDLVLQQNPLLMEPSPEEQKTPLILARNVSDFLVECWDTNANQWDTEWDATNMLPPLVRVTLAFGDKKSEQPGQVITREILFPSSTMPTAVQTPNNSTYPPSFNLPGGPGGGPGAPGSASPYGGRP